MVKKKHRAVLLDRDGTILKERGYLADPRKMIFYPKAFQGLKILQRAGFKLVVISNQSGVARGFFTLVDLKKVNNAFKSRLARRGIHLSGIYFCPHGPRAGCFCRKPNPGMALRAARDLNLDLKSSYVVGDQKRDMALAHRVKATGVLVLTGHGKYYRGAVNASRVRVVSNLEAAGRWILRQEAGEKWKK